MEEQKKVKSKSGKGGLAIVCGLLAVLIALNVGCGMYANVITQFFSKADVDEAATAAARTQAETLVEKVAEEGVVLLENKAGALPLNTGNEKEANLSVFGWDSVSPLSGGTGSGSGTENSVTLIQGLENSGFHVNTELVDFYNAYGFARKPSTPSNGFAPDYKLYEAPIADYTDTLKQNARSFSDVALIVLGRTGGEGSDLATDMSLWEGDAGRHFLELSTTEEALIEMVKSLDFKKVVVVINANNPMELGFLEQDGIDAALWIGGPGQTGMNGVGRVIAGSVNPSGRLVDTYAYDATGSPAYFNAGDFTYSNTATEQKNWFDDQSSTIYQHFLDYAEGIYVGYRYYETRYVNNETGEVDEAAYAKDVQYPFGYGLSYSTFTQEIAALNATADEITMDVKVTNTGSAPGKEVVQVYYTPPYTVGGIEKSHVVLGGFAKTDILAPGASETVSIPIKIEEMASFDYAGKGCYVLESGAYQFKLMKNAHETIDSREHTVGSTITYDSANKRPSDDIAAVSLFNDALGEVKYISRADWAGTLPKARTPDRDATPEIISAVANLKPADDPTAQDIVMKDNNLTLADLTGLDYEDPKWDLLLEQLSVEDMQTLIGFGGYATQAIKSVGKPYAVDLDGPAGINALVNKTSYASTKYTTEVLLASTWNVELSREMGRCYAAEADAWDVSGLYAPAMNIHRTPFSGRNFEYYSEDGLLSGKMTAPFIAAANELGVYSFIKHFAINDQETNRNGVCTWFNEQSARELYFKPFEIAVKEGGSTAVMSSFPRLGTTWAGASRALCTTLLRDEWGFRGVVLTDYDGEVYMNPDQAIRAGNDLMLSTLGDIPTDTSNAGKQAMRSASRNILYTVANSNAMQINYFGPTPYWLYALIAVDVLALAGAVWLFLRYRKRKAQAVITLDTPEKA